jgi:hypothetical protein
MRVCEMGRTGPGSCPMTYLVSVRLNLGGLPL